MSNHKAEIAADAGTSSLMIMAFSSIAACGLSGVKNEGAGSYLKECDIILIFKYFK
jgi:hypothetical protein